MGEPTDVERGLPDRTVLEDPAFLAWAKAIGRPVRPATTFDELMELATRYEYELREGRRRTQERRVAEADRARRPAAPMLPLAGRRGVPVDPAQLDDVALGQRIRNGWNKGPAGLKTQAQDAVRARRPLARALAGSHGFDDEGWRWTFMRHYLTALSEVDGFAPGDDALLHLVLAEERQWQRQRSQEAAAVEAARRPGVQRHTLLNWARSRPMNLVDDFEPGIAMHNLAAAARHGTWMEHGLVEIEQRGYTTTLSYRTGASLALPAREIDFFDTLEPHVLSLFARRHRRSGRLVPFAMYAPGAGLHRELPAIDDVPVAERYLLALPRFASGLTPTLLAFYSDENAQLMLAQGLIKVMSLMTLRRGLPGASQVAAGTLSTTAGLGARVFTLGRAVAAEVNFAVRTHGVTTVAATQLARSAYTYYLLNAVTVNAVLVVGTEIGLTIAGQDMGPMSSGDALTMAVQADDAVRLGEKSWQAVKAEVVVVDRAAGKAVLRVAEVTPLADDVARADAQLGRVVQGEARSVRQAGSNAAADARIAATDARIAATSGGAAKSNAQAAQAAGRVRVRPDPRTVTPMREIEDAMAKVQRGLPKLASKYRPAALARIGSLTADEIRESGIRPSDLAKLTNALSHAGPTTRDFINRFHAVPGFERVLLTWLKRHWWNDRLRKPAWVATKSFYNGAGFVMRYASRRLDPAHVRFEWPVSINDTSWGGEVFARWVDIVVTGGSQVKPGQTLQLELKAWTEFVLQSKAHGQRGGIGYQLTRDTALFRPDNIRWVFDGRKVGRERVLNVFEQVIAADPYLKRQWGGGDRDALRRLIEQVIEVF